MKQDYLAEDNAIAREFFNLLSSDARNALTVEDICVLVGLAAGSRERAVRAELTAPAGGDVGRLLEEFCGVVLDAPTWDRLCEKVQAALTAARKDAIDEEVITADQFFRAAKAEAEHYKARVKALEAAAPKYRRIYKAARKVLLSWREDGPGGATSILITGELADALAALLEVKGNG